MKSESNLARVTKSLVWLLLLLAFLLLIVAPLLTSILVKYNQMPLKYGKFLGHIQTAQFYLMQVFGVAWIFFLGSCFASFLNVVAWRVPRGRGINGSSKCPFCNNKLRFTDNLPIFGWLRNGGQCRGLPASDFASLSGRRIHRGLPVLIDCGIRYFGRRMEPAHFDPSRRSRALSILCFLQKWDLIQIASFHLCLICLLFTFALIRSEGLKIPISIFVTGLILGIGLPLIWPSMLLIGWSLNKPELNSMARFSVIQSLTMAIGLAVGTTLGSILSWFNRAECRALETGSKVRQNLFIDDGVASFCFDWTVFLDGNQHSQSLCSR